jgi:ATP phosphoribosyltransferase regulatory subunit
VQSALEQLGAVLALFATLADDPQPPVSIDLGDLRGFDYYTGVRFAAFAGGAPDAVLRGGRYDELLGRYGRPAHATGFAIDLEAVAQAQRSIGVAAPAASLGVAVHGDGSHALARALRGQGVRTVVQQRAPASWSAWLRGAGLDAAIIGNQLIRADDRTATITSSPSDIPALIALLRTP